MINIAIVEDSVTDLSLLKEHFFKYSQDKGIEFSIHEFADGIRFLNEYTSVYDLVFMDIDMPHLNGIDVIKHLRRVDPSANVIFTTNMSQYALQGFELFALGFLVKPITYVSFFTLMDKVLYQLKKREEKIIVHTKEGIVAIPLNDLQMIEIYAHHICYITDQGVVDASGTLKLLEEQLPMSEFARPNNSTLVNIKYVSSVTSDGLAVGKRTIYMSRGRKKEFMSKFLSYYGKNL